MNHVYDREDEKETVNYIIKLYKDGESLNSIARILYMYPTTVRQILIHNDVPLRHDAMTKGSTWVKDGDLLIEWAKAQGRPVTRAELAAVLGKTRLSNSYFIKYPELSKYLKNTGRRQTDDLAQKLYKWLQDHNIPYKPNDRSKLQSIVTALLLGEYTNVAIQIVERPYTVSKKTYQKALDKKIEKANEVGLELILVNREDINKLDTHSDDFMELLNEMKWHYISMEG